MLSISLRKENNLKEKISIIVPVFKVEEYLDRCVNSLINQTYKNIEIILVDDGSPDKCPEICDEYALKYDNVTVIHKDNGGLSEARNYGLKNSTGEYILYVDSDDWIEIDSCEKLIQGMKHNVDIVVGSYKEVKNGETIIKKHSNILQDKIYEAKDYTISSIRQDEWYAPAWLNLYRKSFLIENNLFYKVGINFEDMEMLPRLFLSDPKVTYVDYPFYNYFIRENSIMTSSFTDEKAKMIVDIFNNWMTMFLKVDDIEYRKYMYGILVKYYIATARQRNFYDWRVDGLDFKFAWKYSLDSKERLKSILFNFFPKFYVKLAKKSKEVN